MAGELLGRVALVTGAGSGIGRAVVELFVAEGARVVMLDLSAERLSEIEGELGGAVKGLAGDVRDAAVHEAAVALAVSEFGGLDVLVANAGVFDGSVRLEAIDPATLKRAFTDLFAINVLGYLLGARAAAPQLRERRGSIVFTVSNAGFHAGSGGGALYTASKHAVVGLLRQLAFELAPEVRVNGVAPGGTITGLKVLDALAPLAGRSDHFEDPAAAEAAIRASSPLRIAAQPVDHAAAYLLLAGGHAPAITGEVISSDGGLGVRGLDFERDNQKGG